MITYAPLLLYPHKCLDFKNIHPHVSLTFFKDLSHLLSHNKVCSVIINGGSCTNEANILFVERTGLTCTKHPNPYKLYWLDDKKNVSATK